MAAPEPKPLPPPVGWPPRRPGETDGQTPPPAGDKRPPRFGRVRDTVKGVLLLARARPEGLALLPATPGLVARSFLALLICIPPFIVLRLLAFSTTAPKLGIPRALALEVLGFVIGWVGFALASKPVAEAMGLGKYWPRFVLVWNWCNVVQYVVLFGLSAPAAYLLPDWLSNGLALAAVGYALWLEWWTARLTLAIGSVKAVGFVVLDLAIGIFVGGLVSLLTGG